MWKVRLISVRAKFLKGIWVVMLSAVLMLSQTVVSFADTLGTMDPEDYVFFLIFRACGVSPNSNYIGLWIEAYKGYLESTHNNALLSQVNSYSSLSWGDTVNGIDVVFESAKNWLSLSDSYGTNAYYYFLPSSNLPLEPDSSMEWYETRVSSRIADVSCDDSNYVYLFSSVSNYSSDGYVITNYYVPKGQEVVGVYNRTREYTDIGEIKFYIQSGSGYSSVQPKYNRCTYDSSGVLKQSSSTLLSVNNVSGLSIRTISNFPFKVFYSISDMKNYFNTGDISNASSSGICRLYSSSSRFDSEIQKIDDCQIGGSLTLPSSSTDASYCWNKLLNAVNTEVFLSAWDASGMDIAYHVPYKLEHCVQKYSADGTYIWEKMSESSHTGTAGESALIEPSEFPGFTYAPELVPEEKTILLDGSLVVPVYYTCNPVSYSVEHYTQKILPGGGGEEWELADTETFQGIPGMLAEYQSRDYSGYTFNDGLTEPSDCQILSDGSLVVRLHYTSNEVLYMVEHYRQKMIPREVGEKWELADTETFQGIPGTEAEYQVKDYPGYSFDGSLTEPSDCQVLSDGSLIVRLYYIQAPFNVLKEPINKAVDSALPVAAVIGSVFSGGLFLLKLYKRISEKA